ERMVRTDMSVLREPVIDDHLCLARRHKPLCIEHLAAERSMFAVPDALLRFARDTPPRHTEHQTALSSGRISVCSV
ncbi:MAG: hypothetical protein AAFV69_12335, partial [Pseudomonadota bacterium]